MLANNGAWGAGLLEDDAASHKSAAAALCMVHLAFIGESFQPLSC